MIHLDDDILTYIKNPENRHYFGDNSRTPFLTLVIFDLSVYMCIALHFCRLNVENRLFSRGGGVLLHFESSTI